MVKKSKNNTILYISISIAVIVVLIIILGFITNWKFFAKKKIDTSQSSNDKPINDSSNAFNAFNIDNVDPEIIEMENTQNRKFRSTRQQNQNEETEETEETEEIEEIEEIEEEILNLDQLNPESYPYKMLSYHNEIRKKCNNTDSLKWNIILANKAKEYAQKLARKYNCQISHFKHGEGDDQDAYDTVNAGENLARFQRKRFTNEKKGNKIIQKTSFDKPDVVTFSRNAINGWAGEGYGEDAAGLKKAEEYNKYRKPPISIEKGGKPMTGHYTAMNWKDSTELGCGFSVGPDNCIVTVCYYGNTPANLLQAGKTKMDYINCTKPLQLS